MTGEGRVLVVMVIHLVVMLAHLVMMAAHLVVMLAEFANTAGGVHTCLFHVLHHCGSLAHSVYSACLGSLWGFILVHGRLNSWIWCLVAC